MDAFAFVAERWIVSDGAEGVAYAFYHVEGIYFSGESIVVFGAAEVEFSNGVYVVALFPEAVVPAWDASVVGEGVVPVANLVDVAPGGQGGASGYADGAVCVGMCKTCTPISQPVYTGSLHHGVAVTAGCVPVVLVREDEEHVGGFHEGSRKGNGRIRVEVPI